MEDIPDIDFRCEIENENENKVEMYLYGSIVEKKPVNFLTGEEIEGDYIYPKKVRDMVNEADDKDIELHINSKGGQVFASVPIHNFLKQADNKVVVYVDGLAASGASIIAMAGDEVIMPDNTNLMIHQARGGVFGTAEDMLEFAENLEKIDESVINSYASRFKGTKAELKKLISDETWLTAEEAVTLGLADKVLDEKESDGEKQNIENNINIKANLLDKFSKKNESKENDEVKENLLSQFK